MVEVPDSTTRYIQSDSGKPTKDLFNWMRNISQQLADILSGTGGGLFSSGLPAFSVHKNGSAQAGVASATTTQVTWSSTEVYDVDNHFASNVWTPPAGRVFLSFAFVADGLITDSFTNVIITKNGATSIFRQAIYRCAGAAAGLVSIDDLANGTDVYGAAVVIPTSAGTSTIRGAVDQTWFMGHWISP